MSEERKKHIRTQGRYSDSGKFGLEKKQKISPTVKEPSEKQVPRRYSNESRGPNNSLSEEIVRPVKYERNSDYSFKELETPKKPIEISDEGKVTLSKTENGKSLIFYEPHFLLSGIASNYFNRLNSTTEWYSKNIVIHGEEYPQPRLVAWYGPYPYAYSGTTLEPAEMPDTVLQIKNSVEKCLEENGMNAKFNSVLLNLYRNGQDSVAWHSDDESTMGISPTIASVSLGETRKFEMRRKKMYSEDESYDEQKYFVNLKHGSLIVMDGCMQEDWQHRVPKEYHDKKSRINLTFRTVFPIEKIPQYPVKELVKKFVDDSYFTKSTKSSKIINFDEENFPPLSSDISLVHSAAEYSHLKNTEDLNRSSESKDSETCFDERQNIGVEGNNKEDAFHATNPVKLPNKNVHGNDGSFENRSWFSLKSPVEQLDQHPRKWHDRRAERINEKFPKNSFNEKPDKNWKNEERLDVPHDVMDKPHKEISERPSKKWIGGEDSGIQRKNRQTSTKKYLIEERLSETCVIKEPLEEWDDEETSKTGSCEEPSERLGSTKKWINENPPKKSFNEKPDKKWTHEERWVRAPPKQQISEIPSQKWINGEDSGKQWKNRQTHTKKYFNKDRVSGNRVSEDPLEKWVDEETLEKWSHEEPTKSWAYEKQPKKTFYEKAAEKCDSDKIPRQRVSETSSEKLIDDEESVKQWTLSKNCFNEEKLSENWVNEERSEKCVVEDKLEKPSTRWLIEDSPQQCVGEEEKLTHEEISKNWLNVEAKEFVPNSSFSYNHIGLEDLLYYEVSLMSGKILQDHAFLLKSKVKERVLNFSRYDRDELDFLCDLTDGSQSDKNQKLIITRMCNILINKLTLSNVEKSYYKSPPSWFNNPRKHINGNQNYTDDGRKYNHYSCSGSYSRF